MMLISEKITKFATSFGTSYISDDSQVTKRRYCCLSYRKVWKTKQREKEQLQRPHLRIYVVDIGNCILTSFNTLGRSLVDSTSL